MYDLDAGIVIAVVPQFLGCLADTLPVHRAVFAMNKLLNDLADSHCEVTTQGIHHTKVVLGNHILASSERAETDHVIKRRLAVQGCSAERAKLCVYRVY